MTMRTPYLSPPQGKTGFAPVEEGLWQKVNKKT